MDVVRPPTRLCTLFSIKTEVSVSVFHCNFAYPISSLNATVNQSIHLFQRHQLISLNWFIVFITSDSVWLMDLRFIWGCWVKHWHDNVIDDNKLVLKIEEEKNELDPIILWLMTKYSTERTIILFISIPTFEKIKIKEFKSYKFAYVTPRKKKKPTNEPHTILFSFSARATLMSPLCRFLKSKLRGLTHYIVTDNQSVSFICHIRFEKS